MSFSLNLQEHCYQMKFQNIINKCVTTLVEAHICSFGFFVVSFLISCKFFAQIKYSITQKLIDSISFTFLNQIP